MTSSWGASASIESTVGATPLEAALPRTSGAPDLYDMACVVHVHSTFSDGTASVEELCESARATGRDAVLLTDHDTLAAKRAGFEGWHGSVLLGVGVEISPRGGHYLAFGVDRELAHEHLDEPEIPAAVREQGGVGFAAHPFSVGAHISRRLGRPHGWAALDDDGLAGIELWNLTTDAAEAWRNPFEAISYMRDPERFLDGPPAHHMRAWDRLCAGRRVVAIGGLDAHQTGIRIGRRLFSPMRNERYFGLLATYVLCRRPPSGDAEADLDEIYASLREGRCFLSVDAIASGRGFRYWAERSGDLAVLGEQRRAGTWTLCAALPRRARVTLVRDGTAIADASTAAFEHSVDAPGAYRIEARLPFRGRERLWLLSNPIYLR